MAVPSTFADLSTTPASNSGLISDATAVNQIDNHLQSVYALIASIYANSGNGWSSPYLPAANPVYTGTLTGGTGIVNLGSGQLYKAGSGNVGIGTASPGVLLDMASASAQVRATSSTGTNTCFANYNNTGGSFRVGLDSSAGGSLATGSAAYSGVIATTGAYPLSLGTNATERLRIDSSGNTIPVAQVTPPTLTINQQMVFNLTSDTNLRISVRGTDGTTRVANITLA